MRTIIWIGAIVLGSVAVALLGLALVRSEASLTTLVQNNDVGGAYLQTVGTLYAVLLGFVLYVVWGQFNDTRAALEREANELADLYRTAHGLPEAVRRQVRSKCQEYVKAVVGEEWSAMAQGESSPVAERTLEEIWLVLERVEPHAREEALYGEVLSRYNDLSDCRVHRVLTGRQRMPPTLWALLVAGGAVTVCSMLFFGMRSVFAHGLMTAALAGLVSFVLYLVRDLDNPFWGDWVVTAEPFQSALRKHGAAVDEPQPAEKAA